MTHRYKTALKGMGLAAVLMISALAVASENIAVVHTTQVLLSSKAATLEADRMRERYAGDRTRLEQLDKEIEQQRKQFETDAQVLSDEENRQRAEAIKSKINEARLIQQRLADAQVKANQDFLQNYRQALLQAIEQVARERNIDMVIDLQAVPYNKAELDITPLVQQAFDQITQKQ